MTNIASVPAVAIQPVQPEPQTKSPLTIEQQRTALKQANIAAAVMKCAAWSYASLLGSLVLHPSKPNFSSMLVAAEFLAASKLTDVGLKTLGFKPSSQTNHTVGLGITILFHSALNGGLTGDVVSETITRAVIQPGIGAICFFTIPKIVDSIFESLEPAYKGCTFLLSNKPVYVNNDLDKSTESSEKTDEVEVTNAESEQAEVAIAESVETADAISESVEIVDAEVQVSETVEPAAE